MLTLFLYRTDKVNNGSYSSASSSIRQKGHFSEKKGFCRTVPGYYIEERNSKQYPLNGILAGLLVRSRASRDRKWRPLSRPLHRKRTMTTRFLSTDGGYIWIIHFHTSLSHVIFLVGAKYQG